MANISQEQNPIAKKPHTVIGRYLLYVVFVGCGILITKVTFAVLTPHFIPHATLSVTAISSPAPVVTATPNIQPPLSGKQSSGQSQLSVSVPESVPETAVSQPLTTPDSPARTVRRALKKEKKIEVSPYALNGLSMSGKDSYALINDKIVQVGEQVDGATVVAITDEGVQLDHNGETIRLKSRN